MKKGRKSVYNVIETLVALHPGVRTVVRRGGISGFNGWSFFTQLEGWQLKLPFAARNLEMSLF